MADDQKAALLAAVAQQGTAGADAYKQYADSVAAQRQAAVQAAQQRASLINAGPAATQELTGNAVATSDPYAQDAATGATTYKNEMARISAANSAFMDQANASKGAIANYVAQGAAKKQAKGTGNPLTDLVNSLGGVDLAKPQLVAALEGIINQKQQEVASRPVSHGIMAGGSAISKGKQQQNLTSPSGKRDLVDSAAGELGIPAGVLEKLLGKDSPDYVAPPTATQRNQQSLAEIRTSPVYKDTLTAAQREINKRASAKDKKGHKVMTRTEAKSQIVSDLRNDPSYAENQAAYEQIIKDLR